MKLLVLSFFMVLLPANLTMAQQCPSGYDQVLTTHTTDGSGYGESSLNKSDAHDRAKDNAKADAITDRNSWYQNTCNPSSLSYVTYAEGYFDYNPDDIDECYEVGPPGTWGCDEDASHDVICCCLIPECWAETKDIKR